MQKILRKRVLRDLKENMIRYLALVFLIILGMYLVVSLVGAAETIITGIEEKAAEQKLEDGEFSLFVPLTEEQEQEIAKEDIILEKMFYLDFINKSKETIRVYKNRTLINKIAIDEGRIARKKQEAVVEKRYCEEHEIGRASCRERV